MSHDEAGKRKEMEKKRPQQGNPGNDTEMHRNESRLTPSADSKPGFFNNQQPQQSSLAQTYAAMLRSTR